MLPPNISASSTRSRPATSPRPMPRASCRPSSATAGDGRLRHLGFPASAGRRPRAAPRGRRMTLKRVAQDDRLQAVLLLGPAILVYLTFAIYPMIDVVMLSFQKWN